MLASYSSFAYSALASFRIRMSGSASFQKAKKSWYQHRERMIASLRHRSCIAREHDVGFDVGTDDAEGPAVGRKLICLDRIGSKIRDLAAGGFIEREPPVAARGTQEHISNARSPRSRSRPSHQAARTRPRCFVAHQVRSRSAVGS